MLVKPFRNLLKLRLSISYAHAKRIAIVLVHNQVKAVQVQEGPGAKECRTFVTIHEELSRGETFKVHRGFKK